MAIVEPAKSLDGCADHQLAPRRVLIASEGEALLRASPSRPASSLLH
jgi:hypothetical protein